MPARRRRDWRRAASRRHGTVNLRSCGRSANRISLIRHTRPGESRRRTGENRPRTAQVDSAPGDHTDPWNATCITSARAAWLADPPQEQTEPGPSRIRTPARLSPKDQMAHRIRRPHQPPQPQLRLKPHRTHRHRRRPNMVRPWRFRPQPRQDQHPRQHASDTTTNQTATPASDPLNPSTATATFSGRSS